MFHVMLCLQAFHSSYDAQLLHDSAPDPIDDSVSLLPRQQRSQSVMDEDKASVNSLTLNNSLTLSLPSNEPKAQTSTCEVRCGINDNIIMVGIIVKLSKNHSLSF